MWSGKLTQKPFAPKKPRELQKHQLLLAIDYVGPMQVTARDGYIGLVNIVELAYPLRDKSSRTQLDVIQDCITKLKAYVPEYRVVFLKLANAAKYFGGEIAAYCKKNGIEQEFSTSYSPQQNGKVERGNRPFVEMARPMMLCPRSTDGCCGLRCVRSQPMLNKGT
ncbi:hypothetical protein PC129_g18180 [Phytophthora cactorum]|uniref:Integrase catalytic domain-containing protein n=1 Tax=Phytophthora cactorum TaxID=29920 RepID=A0A8T1JXB4_9STRA|nr:hypothetical protein Pcac1_g11161 [Phytophthora cactorum]KAG2802716.1 hypothetical protein PC112_g19506 [Phytophthora cactorum]KAG2803545.1 hypothetical protein PC111_g18637 [Phytophthora cactorum]KAG2839826.1 hypothetical protein PC113_g19391 [Phytophthora cactorum]KAG2882037.1 hypothetical protein PC114_g21234 [Phytophthora cactorum]